MPEVTAVSVPADDDRENEDAFALGDGVAVVVDGAGLPKELRSGCEHSVHWYADSLARAFRNQLDRRDSEMPQALASAIAEVVDSHAAGCRLAEGSPSATVAAWRLHLDTIEYLVLCDASIVLGFEDGSATEVTDDRIKHATTPLIKEQLSRIRSQRGSVTVTAADVRHARRAAVEQTRNRDGGFWCCHTDPQAAAAAIHGEVERGTLRAIVAASDGATRGYQLLGIHAPRDVVAAASTGRSAAVIASIRHAERVNPTLTEQGFKQHDDATLVAATFKIAALSEEGTGYGHAEWLPSSLGPVTRSGSSCGKVRLTRPRPLCITPPAAMRDSVMSDNKPSRGAARTGGH